MHSFLCVDPKSRSVFNESLFQQWNAQVICRCQQQIGNLKVSDSQAKKFICCSLVPLVEVLEPDVMPTWVKRVSIPNKDIGAYHRLSAESTASLSNK